MPSEFVEGELTNVWSIVGHHGLQQVFGVSEVAVALDDGVHHGLQLVRLRLYVGCENPSDTLVTIVTFIVRVYAPTWFNIKRKPLRKDGARHLFMMIKNSRYQMDELKAMVDPVIQRNSYFAHPENLLQSMMTDDRPDIR